MARKRKDAIYLLCIDNEAYPASLEMRKVYRTLPDESAMSHGLVRVVDESGEDYLYPESLFVAIEVPSAAKEAFASV